MSQEKKATVQSLSERMNIKEAKDDQFQDETRHHFDKVYDGLKLECSNIVKMFTTRDAQHDEMMLALKNMNDKLTSVESKVDKSEKSVADIQRRVDAVEQHITASDSATYKELYDIEAKRSNIILFGLPEPERTGTSSQKEQDAKVVDGIFEHLTGEKKAFEIKFRIGKKQDDKPRPILVNLRDMHSKDEILSKTNALRDHPLWKTVYIQPDFTKKQQEYNRELEAQLKSTAESRNSELKNGEQWRWVLRGKWTQRHLAKGKILG